MTIAGFRLSAAEVAKLGKPDGPKIWMHPNGTMSVTYDNPPRIAMDALPRRLGRDQGSAGMQPRGMNGSGVTDWLKAHLSEPDFAELMQMIGIEDDNDAPDADPLLPDGTRRSSYAQDAAFASRYPGASKLKRAL
jgi:hypothetical protein